ncbi:DUF2062 domain-containing protein [Amaricoccus macauensis]|uniref:DUF2062 domain-containing protein n=1 Tax=Amaricoccus macauensis TaxID=57001 RepID=UPI003C7BBAB0
MVFKRRDKLPFFSRLREVVYPQKGWRRGIEYLGHRVRRLPDTPHRISLGVACGVFASFTPLFGLHFILAAGLARVVRANILASLIGTAFGNPLTFPFIASVSLKTGRTIVGHGPTGSNFQLLIEAFKDFFSGLWQSLLSLVGIGEPQWTKLTDFLQDVFWPYLVGGLIPGLLSALACYLLCRPIVSAYQVRRRAKLLERISALEAKAEANGKSDASKKTSYIATKKTATN